MSENSPNTTLNAIIGAIVTILFSFTMISPILGGAVAGYLEQRNGARVGVIAGLIAVVPLLLFGAGLFVLFSVPGAAPRMFSLVFLFFVFILAPAYVIGLSALGGYLGVYLRGEL